MSDTTETTSSRSAGGDANFKQRVTREGKEKVESGKRAAANQIGELADAIDAAGSQLERSQPTLSNYATKLAEGVGGLATRLREDSIEDLYQEVRRMASQHPGMFVVGSAAVGLAIARFMKSEGSERFSDWSEEADLASPPPQSSRETSDTRPAGI